MTSVATKIGRWNRLPGTIIIGPAEPGKVLTGSTPGRAEWHTPGSVTPVGPAGGDLSGTYPDPAVAKCPATALVQGTRITIVNTGGRAKITAAVQTTSAVTMGGDVTGGSTASTVAKIHGRAVVGTAPSTGNVLTWTTATSTWTPKAPAVGTVVRPWGSYRAAYWYGPYQNNVQMTIVWKRIYLVPLNVLTAFVATHLGTSGGSSHATTRVRLGLYADNGKNQPQVLLHDFGQVIPPATGTIAVVFTQTLAPGYYWGAIEHQGASTSVSIVELTATYFVRGGDWAKNQLPTNNPPIGWFTTHGGSTSAGLPATLTLAALNSTAGALPSILLKHA